MPQYALTMLAAGIGIPVLAALNAALGIRLGSPVSAALILFTVALISVGVTAAITGAPGLGLAGQQPGHLFLAGVLVAFYVLSITWIAPKFGVGNAIFFVLLGQIISATIIGHFGWLGVRPEPLTMVRLSGILLMAAGIFLTQKV